jgi:peptide/nickel transport system permease protein
MASGALFLILLCLMLAAPLWAKYIAGTGFAETHLSDSVTIDGRQTDVVSLGGVPIGPTWHGEFFLGADELGRDLMVRLLYGARNSLLIAFGALALTLTLALPLSLAAGYFRGRVDAVVSRVLDLIWSFPALLLGVLLGTSLTIRGATIGPITIAAGSKLIPIVVIGVVYVPYMARPLRGQVLALRERQFVEAARAAGARPVRVMRKELLPHLWSSILVLSTVLVANGVVLESALSFLGAGVAPPEPSLGTLIAAGVDTIYLSPHLLVVPSVALVLIVLSLSCLAEGLRRTLVAPTCKSCARRCSTPSTRTGSAPPGPRGSRRSEWCAATCSATR